MKSSDDRRAAGNVPPLILRLFQQFSIDCREVREAISGEEPLQRSSHRSGGQRDTRSQELGAWESARDALSQQRSFTKNH